MFFAKTLIVAALAFTAVAASPLEAQKAEAILWSNADCSGSQSSTIGLHTGNCIDIVNTHSIQFFTDNVPEDYGYYSEAGCQPQDLAFSTHLGSVCVQAIDILSFQKLD